ncbi:hypothetical protein IEE94_09200 [Yimella sp. cx-573]|nr:hypothetical protein [Yimella sp. cx-573]
MRPTLRERVELVLERYAELKKSAAFLPFDAIFLMFEGTLLQSARSAVAGDEDAAMDHIENACRLLMLATVPG